MEKQIAIQEYIHINQKKKKNKKKWPMQLFTENADEEISFKEDISIKYEKKKSNMKKIFTLNRRRKKERKKERMPLKTIVAKEGKIDYLSRSYKRIKANQRMELDHQ